ncbi:MAG TPA: ABC transporter permease [Clostridia bacterium]
MINRYIQNNDAILSIDSHANEDLRKFARIDTQGNKEAFKQTDESKITISKDKNFKLIKSRLPWKNSVKIGASGLKAKPFRLVMTILLSVVAFTLAGLSDTMAAYNKYTITANSLIDSNINAFTLEKQIKIFYDDNKEYYTNSSYSNQDDIDLLNKETGYNFKGLYNQQNYTYSINNFLNSSSDRLLLYTGQLSGYFQINEQDINDLGFSYKGTLPANDAEIAISEYIYKHFENYGYRYKDQIIEAKDIKSQENFLSKNPKVEFDNKELTITAIIDTKFDYDHFSAMTDTLEQNIGLYFLINELEQTVKYGYHGMIFVRDGYIDDLIISNRSKGLTINNANFVLKEENDNIVSFINSVYKLDDIKSEDIVFFDNSKSTLNDDEIIISAYNYIRIIDFASNEKYSWSERDQKLPEWFKDYFNLNMDGNLDKFIRNFISNNYPQDFVPEGTYWYWDNNEYKEKPYTLDYMNTLDENVKVEMYYQYLNQMQDRNEWADYTYNDLMKEYKDSLIKTGINDGSLKTLAQDLNINQKYIEYYNYKTQVNIDNAPYKIAGIYYPDSFIDYSDYPIILNDQLYSIVAEGNDGYFAFLITRTPINKDKLLELVKFGYDNNFDKYVFEMKNGVMATLSQVNSLVENLAKVFLYIGIGFAVFASLMLTNFITISISYKSKEIGILRAIGARSSDVFGIFFNESIIIALINFGFASVATGIIVTLINRSLRSEYNLLITLLNFGLRQIVLLLVVSLAVAFIASFIPVMRIARKKPVDAMKK